MHRFRARLWAFLAIALCLPSARALAGELEVDLLGWRLQQFDHSVQETLGVPRKIVVEGELTSRAYLIGTDAHLIVSTHRQAPAYIHALQVTGHDPRQELIRGLHLGDPRTKVIAALGPPDRVRPLDISPTEPRKLEVLDYDAHNYSVELDPRGNLYSLRIRTTAALLAIAEDQALSDPWPAFAEAVRSGSFARLEPLLRPDIEIYRAGNTLANRRRHRDFMAAPPQAFLDAFFNPDTGVAAAMQQSAPETQTRLAEKMGAGWVYKFPADSVLQEVVFFPYLRTWRVYEVRFREPTPMPEPVERG